MLGVRTSAPAERRVSGGEPRTPSAQADDFAPPRPPTRLSAPEAVALAAADPAVSALGRALPMAKLWRRGDEVVWRISSATIGAQWWVEVDDATGRVGPVHEAGSF